MPVDIGGGAPVPKSYVPPPVRDLRVGSGIVPVLPSPRMWTGAGTSYSSFNPRTGSGPAGVPGYGTPTSTPAPQSYAPSAGPASLARAFRAGSTAQFAAPGRFGVAGKGAPGAPKVMAAPRAVEGTLPPWLPPWLKDFIEEQRRKNRSANAALPGQIMGAIDQLGSAGAGTVSAMQGQGPALKPAQDASRAFWELFDQFLNGD